MKKFIPQPSLEPPRNNAAFRTVMHERFFSSWMNATLTVVLIGLLFSFFSWFLDWAILDAVWSLGTPQEVTELCRNTEGACWSFIRIHFTDFIYGFYPFEYRWRVNVVFLVFIILCVISFLPGINKKWVLAVMLFVYPVLAFVFLIGGVFGMDHVPTDRLSGFTLTLLISFMGIILAFPVGVLLALMRYSKIFMFQYFAIAVIDFFRSSPLVALLFMASVMMPFLFPPNFQVDLIWRVLFVIVMFESAYIAEAVRGGLQSISLAQHEAASSLGLSYFASVKFVILPQALKVAIPGIVNVCIALFKDTSLLAIIGMFELIRFAKNTLVDPDWKIDLSMEIYIFVAFVYWCFCFSMSLYSRSIEKKMGSMNRE